MRARLEEQLGAVGKRVRVSTLHAFALSKLLRGDSGQLPTPIRVAEDWEERWIAGWRRWGPRVSRLQPSPSARL